MSPFTIAVRNLRTRPLPTALTTLIVALGMGLAVCVIVLAGGMQRGLITASGPFELVIGPKGSATQLVLSSVLYQDVPIGNISYATYQGVAEDPRLRDAVPIALGDNLRGLRIIGTTPAFFRVAVTPERPPFYRLASGRPFAADFEAVLGSAAAQQLGVPLGATFASSHGVLASVNETAHAGFDYTVVGMLAPTNTPADLGIYVPLSSYWKVHGATRGSIFTPGATVHDADTHVPGDATGVTAVLARGRNLSATYQLYQQLNAGDAVQAALPGAVLTQFLNVLGQGQQLLAAVSAVGLVMAALSMMLALYGAVLARRRDIAIMRALGAARRTIVAVALYEALAQGLVGALAGLLLGHGTAAMIAWVINQRSALAVTTAIEFPAEALLLLAVLALGVLAGVLPAVQAYRTEAAPTLATAA